MQQLLQGKHDNSEHPATHSSAKESSHLYEFLVVEQSISGFELCLWHLYYQSLPAGVNITKTLAYAQNVRS